MRVALGILAALTFLGALVFATLRETGVSCEVCVAFEGARACRTASAADREGAVRTAVGNACAVLSSGVTRGMQCDRTPPERVHCTE